MGLKKNGEEQCSLLERLALVNDAASYTVMLMQQGDAAARSFAPGSCGLSQILRIVQEVCLRARNESIK